MKCEIAIRDVIFFSPNEEHIFLSEKKFYWYRPEMKEELPTSRSISDFWIVEKRGGSNFRATIGNEVLIGPSEIRYYLRVKYQRKGQQQPLMPKYPIKGYRIPGDDDRHLGSTDLFPTVHLWHLPFPFETGTHSEVCHRLDPEQFDRKTGKPYIYTVHEPTCQYCHNWLLPGNPHRRPAVRTVDAYYSIAPGQKYCSQECRYKAQLERQRYRYNYSRGNFKKIAPDGWINVRHHLDMSGSSIPHISIDDLQLILDHYKAQTKTFSRIHTPTDEPPGRDNCGQGVEEMISPNQSIDDLPRCDNCGGIIQRKRMKRSEGKGQYCSDRCRKAYKRKVEKESARGA
ncbi:hypothetical protein [Methanoculleus methanifontis]|nr:hypothetical protein [Methanoculleus sp. FWC-SCC3]